MESLILSEDAERLAEVFLGLKTKEQALTLLKNIIYVINPTEPEIEYEDAEPGTKRLKTDVASYLPNELPPDTIYDGCIMQDEVDSLPYTCVIMIPNEVSVVANIIGKQGANVQAIKQRTNSKVQVDRTENVPPGMSDRHVFITGTVHSVFLGLQLTLSKVHEKSRALLNTIKLVIPNELTSHLIGRAGAVIKKIQADTGATLQVHVNKTSGQTRSNFSEQDLGPMAIGRTVIASGSDVQMLNVIYLVMRLMAADEKLPSSWKGHVPSPITGPSTMTMAMTAPLQAMGYPQAALLGSFSAAGFGGQRPVLGVPTKEMARAGGARQEVIIPDSCVSYIIGKRGTLIQELQATSQSNVEIAKTCDPGTADRRVFVTGTPQAVAQAVGMLDERVKEWQSRNVLPTVGITMSGTMSTTPGAGASATGLPGGATASYTQAQAQAMYPAGTAQYANSAAASYATQAYTDAVAQAQAQAAQAQYQYPATAFAYQYPGTAGASGQQAYYTTPTGR